MSSDLKNMVEDLSCDKKEQELKYERLKFIYLSVIFFFIIGAYTIIRNLKNSIFMGLIGKEYVPMAKLVVLIFLVPAILFYSKLVDRVKRYYLLAWYSIAYAVGCIVFAYVIGHPSIGILNTEQSPYRIFGWIYYVFVEGFTPFVLSVFWAFSNSVNKPDSAKRSYGQMVSVSKVGGIFTSLLAWAIFSYSNFTIPFLGDDVSKMRFILFVAAAFLFVVPVLLKMLIKRIPKGFLHGYEAVYDVEKKMDVSGKSDTGIFAGLKMFVKYPYVLGIFGMIFMYETLDTILGYLRLGVAEKAAGTLAGTTAFFFWWDFIMHAVGLVISFFGTTTLLKKLGTRTCVFLIPIIMGAGLLCFVFTDNTVVAMIAITMIKSFHYAFDKPVVESLYIPTLKEIRFKSKAWIDAFGSKVAKGSGSVFNLLSSVFHSGSLFTFTFATIIGVWAFIAFFLGRRFDEAIANNEAIGADKNDILKNVDKKTV